MGQILQLALMNGWVFQVFLEKLFPFSGVKSVVVSERFSTGIANKGTTGSTRDWVTLHQVDPDPHLLLVSKNRNVGLHWPEEAAPVFRHYFPPALPGDAPFPHARHLWHPSTCSASVYLFKITLLVPFMTLILDLPIGFFRFIHLIIQDEKFSCRQLLICMHLCDE